jgi:rod shape determining protein RodA
MVDRRLIYHFDVMTMLLVLTIVGLGTVSVYSASWDPHSSRASAFAWRQATWATMGVLATLAMVSFDYRKLERYAYVAYAAGLSLLVAVPLVGTVSNGSRRWLDFGAFSVQPSELMKLALIVVLARYFHRKMRPEGLRLRDLLMPALLTVLPVGLILAQPDLGTAGVFCFVAASMVLLAGPSARTYGILAGGALCLVPLLPYLSSHLKPYQLKRIETFLNPELDPLGAGYHVIQSKIAIGSGGFSGKGFLSGTQNQLKFLPEQHTDFIFSVFSEEWGFLGSMLLVTLYLALMLRGLVVVNPREGALRLAARVRRAGEHPLAGGDQPRHDDGRPAGRRDHAAALQLRRLVAHDPHGGARAADQRQHAALLAGAHSELLRRPRTRGLDDEG